jgi:hypothetical protein
LKTRKFWKFTYGNAVRESGHTGTLSDNALTWPLAGKDSQTLKAEHEHGIFDDGCCAAVLEQLSLGRDCFFVLCFFVVGSLRMLD